MSDSSNNSQAAEETGLRVVSDPSLSLLSKGAAPALEEMVSRSLAQIQSNRTSGLIQSGSELVAPLKAGDERKFEIAPGVKIVMCWIPPGKFLMGSQYNDNQTLKCVQITNGFWLAKTQTTQAQWQAVMGSNPSYFRGDELPVEHVSWIDICGDETRTGGFLGKLNQMLSGNVRFDLPTEAQWDYACLAGSKEFLSTPLDEIAWYKKNSNEKTHHVCQKSPNRWGLHDMLGNVYELCADWYGPCEQSNFIDPKGPTSGSYFVSRGGCCVSDAEHCCLTLPVPPSGGGKVIGFRIICSSIS